MRDVRSSTKRKRTAPFDFSFVPTPQARMAAVPSSSGVVPGGTRRAIQTRIWFVVSRSKAARDSFSASARSFGKTPAPSVT